MMSESQDIQALIMKLSDLGYKSFQIREIINECIETQDLQFLTSAQEAELIDTLQNYVDFAIKCRSTKIK
ncbi:hypothetical protein [Sporomusa aerivorans]|uniref:hypothetical protein n=1 Tax=Sporomusa aerivorans TaxID=204936 RepID=UPI00352A5387